jgi:hypothetical protein
LQLLPAYSFFPLFATDEHISYRCCQTEKKIEYCTKSKLWDSSCEKIKIERSLIAKVKLAVEKKQRKNGGDVELRIDILWNNCIMELH